MNISNCRRTFIVACLIAGLASTVYSQKDSSEKGTVADAAISHLDQYLVDCLIRDNENEIAAAKLVEKHSSNRDVQEFAGMLQRDHQKFISDLEMFASPTFRNRMDERKLATTNSAGTTPAKARIDTPAAPRDRPAAPPPSSAAEAYGRLLQIKEEFAAECQSSIEHELEGKKGVEFDDAYIGLMIAAHIQKVDLLRVLDRHVAHIVQPVLKKGRETAQNHLDRAKAIMQDLAKAQAANSKAATEE